MNCDELLKALNEYVDGTLDPAVCDAFREHLAGCNPCQIVVDNIRKTIALYKGQQLYELPAPFRTRLHQALQDKWNNRPATSGEISGEDPEKRSSARPG